MLGGGHAGPVAVGLDDGDARSERFGLEQRVLDGEDARGAGDRI
jgi:hypothetical protein